MPRFVEHCTNRGIAGNDRVLSSAAAGKRGGSQKGAPTRPEQIASRTVILFSDATILTETPPSACKLVSARRSGPSPGQRQTVASVQRYLAQSTLAWAIVVSRLSLAGTASRGVTICGRIRNSWRGWNIVLFLDRGSPHTAQASRQLAVRVWGSNSAGCRRPVRN